MATKNSSSRSTVSRPAKALRALTHSRTAGIVTAIAGAALTTAVGAMLVKKARGSSARKKSAASAKRRSAAKARPARRAPKQMKTASARRS